MQKYYFEKPNKAFKVNLCRLNVSMCFTFPHSGRNNEWFRPQCYFFTLKWTESRQSLSLWFVFFKFSFCFLCGPHLSFNQDGLLTSRLVCLEGFVLRAAWRSDWMTARLSSHKRKPSYITPDQPPRPQAGITYWFDILINLPVRDGDLKCPPEGSRDPRLCLTLSHEGTLFRTLPVIYNNVTVENTQCLEAPSSYLSACHRCYTVKTFFCFIRQRISACVVSGVDFIVGMACCMWQC